MTTYTFRLARKDGNQHLGELLNVTVEADTYFDAEEEVIEKYKEYFIVGYTAP